MPRSWFGKKKPGTSAADIALWVAGRATSASGRSQSLGLPLQPLLTAAAVLLLLNATVSPIASTPAEAAAAREPGGRGRRLRRRSDQAKQLLDSLVDDVEAGRQDGEVERRVAVEDDEQPDGDERQSSQ